MALPTLGVTPGAGATINTLPNAPQPTANSVAVALASDQSPVPIDGGTAASGVTIKPGGSGLLGWLSSLYSVQGANTDTAWDGIAASPTLVGIFKAIWAKLGGAPNAVAVVASNALAHGLVAKNSAGGLLSLSATVVSTAETTGFIVVIDAAAIPAPAAAIQPIACRAVDISGGFGFADLEIKTPIRGSAGLVALFTKNASPFIYTPAGAASTLFIAQVS